MLGDTSNKRAVRILPECILVLFLHLYHSKLFINGMLDNHRIVAHVKLPESNSEKAEYTDDLSLSSR